MSNIFKGEIMSTDKQLFVVLIMFILSFILIRGLLSCVKNLYLSKSQRKKKIKQSFKEWILYSRYKKEIPIWLYILYYFIISVHLLSLLFIIVTYIFEDIIFITQILTISIYIFDICWCFVIYFLSWQPGGSSLHFDQLVGQPLRRKRNKNKNK